MTSYKELKKKYKVYYKAWMGEETYCKLLKKKVKINWKGWDHLISGTKSKRRTIKDKAYRLNLLKAAKHVIKTAKKATLQTEDKVTYQILEGEYKEKGKILKIKVILKKNKQGDLFFYSVMKK